MWSHNLKLYLIYIKINSSSHTLKVQWSQFSSFTNHVQANETRIKDGHYTSLTCSPTARRSKRAGVVPKFSESLQSQYRGEKEQNAWKWASPFKTSFPTQHLKCNSKTRFWPFLSGWVDWEISVIRLSQHWIHSVTCAGFCVQRGQSTQSGPVEEKSGQSQRGEQHHEGGGSPTTSPRGARGGDVCVVRIRGVIRQGHLKHICI